MAQTFPPLLQNGLPEKATPGTVIQKQAQPDSPDRQNQNGPASDRRPPAPVIEKSPELTPAKSGHPEASTEQTFAIRHILVVGATLLSHEEIQKAVAPYENRAVSLSDLQALCDQLTHLYDAKGYITSRVFVPAQDVHEGGDVTLQAIEGRIGKVDMLPARYYNRRAILAHIALEKGSVLQKKDLEDELEKINDNPDINLTASLKPGNHPGESDVDLIAKPSLPLHFTPFFDNLGRQFIGRKRLGFSFVDNSLLGIGDRSNTTLNWTKSSFGLSQDYNMPVGKRGLSAGMSYAHTVLRVGDQFASLNVRGSASVYSPYLDYPLIHREHWQLSSHLSFNMLNSDTTVQGQLFSRDHVRDIRPAFDLEQHDATGTTSFQNEFAFGIPLFDSTSSHDKITSRAGAGSNFFRYTGTITRLQKLPLIPNSFVILKGVGQLSPSLLTPFQQLSIGGTYSVRGYKEGRSFGDSGFIVGSEFRLPCFLLPASWHIPRTTYNLRENIQIAAFSEYGIAFVNRPGKDVKEHESLLGVGLGLRVRLTRFLVGRFDVGVPLIRGLPDRQDAKIHFGLQSEIF